MPWNVFEDFMDEIEAEKDETTGRYYVDCADATDLPNLTVQLDGAGYLNDLHFPPAAYVDLTAQDGKCEVLLRSDGSHSDAPAGLFWTFGNRLWEYYCVVLNYDTGKVGFGQLQH